MPAPSLLIQTTYAELLERCATSAFADAFPEKGSFVAKDIKGKRYWYFQMSSENGRGQRYAGPDTPTLLAQIAHHKETRQDERERVALVSSLVRQGFHRLPSDIGNIIEALAKAGVFRVRSVLVGTVAYQSYAAMLGEKLPSQSMLTGDIDIAQFASTSRAVGEQEIPVVEILKEADKTFRAVPSLHSPTVATSYQRKGLRIDFLTPNEGPDTDEPTFLPALQTHARPLRFLDFLIHDAEPAILLHGAGIYANVPKPERYAIHKLIVARRRSGASAKRDKDLQQAAALINILAEKRPAELRTAWAEAESRGPTWQTLLVEGLSRLPQLARDTTLKTLDRNRSSVPDLELTFQSPRPRFDFDRDVVLFDGEAAGERVQAAISGEALDDHYDATGLPPDGRIAHFQHHRSEIEGLARIKYRDLPVEQPGAVLLRGEEIPALRKLHRTRQ